MNLNIGDLLDLTESHGCGWSIGTFGAIAEFGWDEHEDVHVRRDDDLAQVFTSRGGVRLRMLPEILPVAYEGLARDPSRWSQGVSLCLPAEAAVMHRRQGLTELGPDSDALRPEDRKGILFDLGLDAPAIDFCIRTSDPALIATLREELGKSVLTPESVAMRAIKLAEPSPNRVVISKVGRVEVYSRLPSRLKGDTHSPEGPHTHVLPDLLKHRRTHAATVPIPEKFMPVMNIHPENPVTDKLGNLRPFDPAAHRAFQALIAAFAPPGWHSEKARIIDAVTAGADPSRYREADSRLGRLAARVALRQLGWMTTASPVLEEYKARFDRIAEEVDSHGSEAGHH